MRRMQKASLCGHGTDSRAISSAGSLFVTTICPETVKSPKLVAFPSVGPCVKTSPPQMAPESCSRLELAENFLDFAESWGPRPPNENGSHTFLSCNRVRNQNPSVLKRSTQNHVIKHSTRWLHKIIVGTNYPLLTFTYPAFDVAQLLSSWGCPFEDNCPKRIGADFFPMATGGPGVSK